jgi:hypothetical protein
MPRVLLTEEEKKQRRYEYNMRPDVKAKREAINNTQYLCKGCGRYYGYTHKKDHFTGSVHKYFMNKLKEKNEDHIEQHTHID